MALCGTIAAPAGQRVCPAGIRHGLRLTAVIVPVQIPTTELEPVAAVDAVEITALAVNVATKLIATTDIVNAATPPFHGRHQRPLALNEIHGTCGDRNEEQDEKSNRRVGTHHKIFHVHSKLIAHILRAHPHAVKTSLSPLPRSFPDARGPTPPLLPLPLASASFLSRRQRPDAAPSAIASRLFSPHLEPFRNDPVCPGVSTLKTEGGTA